MFLVLVLSAIMFLAAGTLLILTMTEIHLSDFEQRSAQAFYAAESSVVLGMSRLQGEPDYRTNYSEPITIGTNTGMLSVEFYEGVQDGSGHYLKALKPLLYRLIIRGIGTVPGSGTAVHRTVERKVTIKPFALFAYNGEVTLQGDCTIDGNIHGNFGVNIGEGGEVKDDYYVTSSDLITIHSHATVEKKNVSSEEPPIFPPIIDKSPVFWYYKEYFYEGTYYLAQPLKQETVILEGEDPPYETVERYSGTYSSENPAGVFYPLSAITGGPVAIDVSGTLVIPPGQSFSMSGAMTIQPVDNFPAIISEESLNITLMGNLETYSDRIPKSQLKGLIFSDGSVTITGNNTTGEIITGSIIAQKISIACNSAFYLNDAEHATYSDPPPGFKFIETGEWQEVLRD